MNTEKIEQLIEKYFDGGTSLEEEKELRNFFRQKEVPAHLKSYVDQFSWPDAMAEAGTEIDPMAKIENSRLDSVRPLAEGRQSQSGNGDREVPSSSTAILWALRIAAGIILVLTGLTAGLLLNQQDTSEEQLAALQSEISQMKSALMYSSVQQASASERISAVHMSTQLPVSGQLDEEITDILIYTMNNDQNVNVRLAAAEALFKFRDEPRIGKALTNALPRQTDPLMQITLIDMLVEMKQRTAVNEMQKMLLNSETQDIVKKRLESSIAELKV